MMGHKADWARFSAYATLAAGDLAAVLN